MSEYYYENELGKQHGPLTLDDLRNEPILNNTLVWKKGTREWKEAKTFDELRNILTEKNRIAKEIAKSTPPPLPNKKERELGKIYDLSYEQTHLLTIVGAIVLVLFSAFLIASKSGEVSYDSFIALNSTFFIVRIIQWYMILQSAKELNREDTGWGLAGFFFPSITMIIIGTKRKYKVHPTKKSNPTTYQKEDETNLSRDYSKMYNSIDNQSVEKRLEIILEQMDYLKRYKKLGLMDEKEFQSKYANYEHEKKALLIQYPELKLDDNTGSKNSPIDIVHHKAKATISNSDDSLDLIQTGLNKLRIGQIENILLESNRPLLDTVKFFKKDCESMTNSIEEGLDVYRFIMKTDWKGGAREVVTITSEDEEVISVSIHGNKDYLVTEYNQLVNLLERLDKEPEMYLGKVGTRNQYTYFGNRFADYVYGVAKNVQVEGDTVQCIVKNGFK